MSSWLQLERYAAGETDATETRALEDALGTDPDARALLEEIRADQRPMPPLREPRSNRALWVGGVALLAAAALVVVARPDGPPAVKGGDIALELVLVRDGAEVVAPVEVRAGDRLGLRVTCPPDPSGDPVDLDVVVFHRGEAAFPIPAGRLTCGNRVPVAGAFSVDRAGPLVACVALGGVDRAALASGPDAADACVSAEVRGSVSHPDRSGG